MELDLFVFAPQLLLDECQVAPVVLWVHLKVVDLLGRAAALDCSWLPANVAPFVVGTVPEMAPFATAGWCGGALDCPKALRCCAICGGSASCTGGAIMISFLCGPCPLLALCAPLGLVLVTDASPGFTPLGSFCPSLCCTSNVKCYYLNHSTWDQNFGHYPHHQGDHWQCSHLFSTSWLLQEMKITKFLHFICAQPKHTVTYCWIQAKPLGETFTKFSHVF